jgi:hypothetical protein
VLLLPSLTEDYYLDGRFWPAVTSEGVLVPPGRHSVSLDQPWYRSLLSRGEMRTFVVNLSADLLESRALSTGLWLRYRSAGRAVIALNLPPLEVRIDNRLEELPPVHGTGGRWWLVAPKGEHEMEILTTTQTGVVLNLWSWLSASAITTFGAVTTLLMVIIYAYIRVRRLVLHRGRRTA